MKITILGSGTNIHPTRAAAGYMVITDQPILLDFGPRTLANLIQTGVDRHTIRHLLFTHYHADHFSDFIPFFFDAVCHSKYVKVRHDLTIHGPPGTKNIFRTLFRTIPNFSDSPFRVTLNEVHDRTFALGDTSVTPRPMTHTNQQICLGYRLEYQGRSITYSGDAVASPHLIALCRNVDLAILDCSFSSSQPGGAHMHAEACGKVARKARVKRLILSHFYQIADRSNVVAQARKHFSGPIIKGKDLLTLQVGRALPANGKKKKQIRPLRKILRKEA